MKTNPVVWFEIYVDDMQRARTFYEAVLQVKLENLTVPEEAGLAEMWAFPSSMENTGASGALTKMDGFTAGKNSTLVYFACEDCATEAARVADAGGAVVQEKMPIGEHGFIALITDTEGNMMGLHSMQ